MKDFVLARLAAPLLLGTALAAQGNVLIVDQQNGPGTDFTDLPPAVAAATPGSTIQVRPGGYTGIFVDKGIHIVGTPGVVLARLVHPRATMFSVNGVPSGQTFTMRDVQIGPAFFGGPVISSNQGRVVFDGVSSGSFLINNCRQVELRRCDFVLQANSSTLTIDDHDVTGSALAPFRLGALTFDLCTVVVTDSQITGISGAPGITMTNTDLTIAMRRQGSFVRSGTGSTNAVGSVAGTGTLRLDPNSVLQGWDPNQPNPPSPSISGPTVQVVDVPTMRSDGGGIGDTFVTEVAGAPGQPYLVLFGGPGTPTSIPGVGGQLWVGEPVILSGGTFQPTAFEQLPSVIPAVPILIGVPVSRQVVSLDAQGGLQLSNPITYAIRP